MNRVLTAEELTFLRATDSPTIANAIERFEVRARTEGYIGGNVRCAFPDLGVMVGRALTVSMGNPADRPADPAGFWALWEALAAFPGPSIIAIADVSGAAHRAAYAGEIMASLAMKLGAVGMVADGGLRDLDEVRALGFHYFMRYPVVSHGNFEIVSVGDPIELDGQRIATGDLLHGDANGVVVIPWEVLDRLEARVESIRASESADLDFIRGPEFSLEGYQARRGYGAGGHPRTRTP